MLLRPTHRIPSQPDLTQTLRGLLDRDVSLSKAEAHDSPSYRAVYVDDAGTPVNVVSVDLPLAASASAALALVPVAQVDEWLAAGTLTDDARDTLHEILNVLAATHNHRDGSRHVKLASLHDPGQELPPDVARAHAAPELVAWYHVDVAGYPGGLLETAAF